MGRPRKGLVWDIRPYSIHDGPGIRTTVFLKGCPLRCAWCCNPEAQNPKPEVLETGEGPEVVGRLLSVEKILEEIGREEPFHRRSGGGITLSGGEPFSQSPFVRELLGAYKSAFPGGHTAVETCGYAAWGDIAPALPLIDLVLFDLKHMDGGVHKRWTGVSNRTILSNARRIALSGTPLVFRLPIIPGINDAMINIDAAARFAQSLPGVRDIHLLPYHRWGAAKHSRMGREYALAGKKPPAREKLEKIRARLERTGFKVKIGG